VPGRSKFALACLLGFAPVLFGQSEARSTTGQAAYKGFYELRADGTGLRRLLSASDGAVEAISPDRRTVVVQRGDSDLETVSLRTDQHRPLVTLAGITGGGQGLVTWSPDGETIAFDRADDSTCSPGGTACAIWEVWLVDPDGTNLRRLSAHALQPAFSPSGKRVAFIGSYDTYADTGTVAIASLDGKRRRDLDQGGWRWRPTWSPDGHCVAYTVSHPPGYEARVACLNGRRQNLGFGYALGWSPQGALLVSGQRRYSRLQTYYALVPRGRRKAIVLASGQLGAGVLSPQGRKFAFAWVRQGQMQLIVRDVRARRNRVILKEAGAAGAPASLSSLSWSKNGGYLFFGLYAG
jgi:Tol biopolymer transport system component